MRSGSCGRFPRCGSRTDVDLAAVLKVIHALVGIVLVIGLVGRWVTLVYAARLDDIRVLRGVLGLGVIFERMVIASSLFVLVLGLLTSIAQDRPFLGPLQGAPVDWLFVSLVLYVSVSFLVPLVFLPRGRVFQGVLDDATKRGEVTDELRLAFRDRVVVSAHVYEMVAVTIVLVLMIAKPF
ncbi:MAG TPA: DUF2269 family protein [Candidatus Limnocylindrales bacterium]|nr:DUF2269 family protein [Candidatus Limnocylindrales bacterium]